MKQRPPFVDEQRLERFLLFATICLSVLVLAVNVHDSGILKTPVLVLCATLLLSVALAKGIRRGSLQLAHSPMSVPLGCFLLIAILSAYFSGTHRATDALLIIISSAICLQSGVQLFNTRHKAINLFRSFAFIAGVACLIGLTQYFFADKLPIEFYIGPERRVGSTLGSPAFFGGYIVLMFPVLLSQALSHEQGNRIRMGLGVLSVILIYLLFVTQSRSSIIAFSISMVLFGLLMRQPLLVIGVLIASAIVVMSSPALVHRFGSILDGGPSSTLERRWYFWEAGVRAFMDSPVFGHGIGSYESVMVRFRSPEYWIVKSEDIVPHAHNEIIETATETGIPGILALVVMFAGSLWSGVKTIRQTDGWKRLTACGLVCGIFGVLVDNMANVSMRQPPIIATTWLFLGLLVSPLLSQNTNEPYSLSVPNSRKAAWIPVVLWLLFVIPYLRIQQKVFKANTYLIKAISAAAANKPTIAFREYERAVALDSTNYLILSGMAVELLKLNQPEKVLLLLAKVGRDYPQYPRDALMEAVALLSLNRLEEARSAIQREINRRDHPEAFYIQSLIYKNLADSAGERNALVSVVERTIAGHLPVELPYALSRLNTLSERREDKEHLCELNERLLAAFPQDRVVAGNLMQMYRSLGDTLHAEHLSNTFNFPPGK